jgi:hypothetical protein
MAVKKKSKKRSTKRTVSKKVTTTRRAPNRRAAAKKTANKKSAAKARKTLATKRTAKKKTIRTGKPEQTAVVNLNTLGSSSGVQSGDLQGVSNVERADSESVDELLEEGNASEAGIVTGVEQAEDDAEGEVRTHEVPEDDVPEEYLDKE